MSRPTVRVEDDQVEVVEYVEVVEMEVEVEFKGQDYG